VRVRQYLKVAVPAGYTQKVSKSWRKTKVPFKKGDFLLIEYTAKVKETGDVFDTTHEEVARKRGLHKEGEIYEPKLTVIGERWLLETLDDSLLSLSLNKPKTIEISPNKAFGLRDPEKLKMVSQRRLRERGVTPKIGMRIEYDKKPATIRTVGAGRVTLDFNPPLAGKTLLYEINAKKKLRTQKEKIAALLHRRIPSTESTKFTLDIQKDRATIHIPEAAFYINGIQLAKRGIATDIQRFFSRIKIVEFVESFRTSTKVETKKKSSSGKGASRKRKTKRRTS
jgi:peptidylprolyl isomerase